MDFSQFDPTQLAAQVERARIAAERFDPTQLAAQVERARIAAERFDPTQLAAQVERARIAAERFDPTQLAAQVERARIAAERFDPTQLAAQVERARIAAERFDPTQLAAQVERVRIAASKLLAQIPRLTPELFGGALKERVAGAVGRLEHTEALAEDISDAADLKRAIDELAEDTATVKEATPPEAQEGVNTRLFWLWVQRLSQLARVAEFLPVAFDVLMRLLGVNASDLPTVEELMVLLGLNAPSDLPPVPPVPDLPTAQELKPVPNHQEEDSIDCWVRSSPSSTPSPKASVAFVALKENIRVGVFGRVRLQPPSRRRRRRRPAGCQQCRPRVAAYLFTPSRRQDPRPISLEERHHRHADCWKGQ